MNDIGAAVQAMKQGKYLTRSAWPGITYVYLDGEIFKYSNLGIDSVWMPSNLDLLATDWEITTPSR